MNANILVTALLLGSSAGSVACGDSRAAYGESQEDYSYERREDFRTAMSRSIDELEARLDRLREKAAAQGEKVEAGTEQLIQETRDGLARLREDLERAGATTREHWDEFKRSFAQGMDSLRHELDQAFA